MALAIDTDTHEEMKRQLAQCEKEGQDMAAEIERLQHAVALYSEGSEREGAEIVRLRAAIKQAHGALTKSSLTPDERVHDATAVLSRHI